MKFPRYKVQSLIGVFISRMLRSEYLDAPQKLLTTWGRNSAYNTIRIMRIGNLPLISTEISPWRQYILHEVSYHETRLKTYANHWQKAYERCYLALRKLKKDRGMPYSHWNIRAYTEATRLKINLTRDISSIRSNSSPDSWDASYKLIAWIFRQKPPPVKPISNAWDLAFSSISRDTFRSRRFEWDACLNRQLDNLKNKNLDRAI